MTSKKGATTRAAPPARLQGRRLGRRTPRAVYRALAWKGKARQHLPKGGDQAVRENAVSASIGGTPAPRSGSWKYIAAPGSGGWGKGGDQNQPVQLYDLANDIAETKNLAAAMPEKVIEMKALLEKLITEGRSTPGAKQPNDVEVRRHPAQAAAKAKSKSKAAK